MSTLKPSEHAEQAALITWALYQENVYPELRLLFAIPNGGQRNKGVAAKLQAEGVKAGVPDLFLPVARNGKHGLFIEMKVGRNKQSEAQLQWMEDLQAMGFEVVVCYSADEAMAQIKNYLQGANQ